MVTEGELLTAGGEAVGNLLMCIRVSRRKLLS